MKPSLTFILIILWSFDFLSFACCLVDLRCFGCHVEFEVNYVAILNFIFFSALLVKSFSLHFCFTAESCQIIVRHDFSADKTTLKISVNYACSLRSLGAFSDSPALDFIFTGCKVMDESQMFVPSLSDLMDHGGSAKGLSSFVACFFVWRSSNLHYFFFEVRRVWHHRTASVFVDPFEDFWEPLVFLRNILVPTDIDQVNNRL